LHRNCHLKHVIIGNTEGKIEVTGIRGRRHKQLPDGLKENIRNWKLKEEALDFFLWRIGFEIGNGPVVQTTK